MTKPKTKKSHNQLNLKASCYFLNENGSKTEWKGGWVSKHSSVEFAGRKLPNMIYVGIPPEQKNMPWLKRYPHHVYIDPNLEIIDAPHETRKQMSSTARTYDKISPADRGHYLNWLEDGRGDLEYDPGYLIMYVMGLEYLYFIDDRDRLNSDVLNNLLFEIDLLLRLNRPNPIKEKLLQFRQFIFLEIVQYQYMHFGAIRNCGDADSFYKILGGRRAGSGLPLKSSTVLHFLRRSLTNEIKEVYDTCLYVFEQQFMAKFDQEYPDGLQISAPEKDLLKSYTAFNDDFEFCEPIIIDGQKIPDISDSEELKNVAISIGTIVADELRPYCNELKQNMLHIKTTKEIEFLPDMGANSGKKKADELLKQWINENSDGKFISFRKILSLFEDSTFKDITTIKLNENRWYQTLAALNRIGYGVVPDLYTAAADVATDDEVTLIKYESDFDDRTKSSGNYFTELLSLALGVELFAPKSMLSVDQLAILTERQINAKGLTKSEIARLEENFERMLELWIHSDIFKFIRDTPNDIDKTVIRNTFKFYAEQDYSTISERIVTLVKLYQALDIDVSLIKSDLKSISDVKIDHLQLIEENEKLVQH